ncbi:SDR family NAD(P)-dependent oxidoreductase [Nocardia sp. BMG111209]|uniref:SDR family NAD(P)-dependent oxidoreductase n=1 Tax=Nocardia sp. BMG111209 TaxID=1160137 RepID=UPI00036EB6EF|nr:SDR family NAD(P)-dependent oxidoreductase [Nocardia sp. BMG111209]
MADSTSDPGKTIVVSGATDGMGKAVTLSRLARGDRLVAVGSNPAKFTALIAEAERLGAADRLHTVRADLSSIAENRRVIDEIAARYPAVDALLLFANRHSPRRRETVDGLEYTFALYYLSRYLLSRGLGPQLDAAANPVIVTVAGVGTTAGAIDWDDPQSTRGYRPVRAMIQGARANDLLGVGFAQQRAGRARFVMYHPGFTRSGDSSPLPLPVRILLRVAAALKARPIAESIAPIDGFIDHPPAQPLTAIDRGDPVDPALPTLDPGDARRLADLTEELLHRMV